MSNILEFFHVVVRNSKILKIRQTRETLDDKYIIIGQINNQQVLIAFQILNFSNHIMLQEQILQSRQAAQPLNFLNNIILQIQSLQINIFLQPNNLLNTFKM
jgi:hypothetical protein